VTVGETFWSALVAAWYPDDPFAPTDAVRRYYETKHEIVARCRPRSICEIGIRAGYSAFTFLWAVPGVHYLGIDNGLADKEDAARYLDHAAALLRRFTPPGQMGRVNSQEMRELPRAPNGGPFEFVHVDGDHSYAGCLHDLQLAMAGAKWVLVDDVDTGLPIRSACQRQLLDAPGWTAQYIPDGLAGNLLLARHA
jgi:predicted O-methyltransferase YrrM